MLPRWAVYSLLAYAFSWAFMLLYVADDRGLINLPDTLLPVLGPVSTFGPLFATIILVRQEGRLKAFFRKAVTSRFPLRYLVVALLLWPILQGLGFAAALHFGAGAFDSGLVISLTAVLPVFLQTFIIGGPLGEEFGWRGYALPELLKTKGPLAASIILGLIHAFWHLPAWLVVGEAAREMPFALFVLIVVSQTPIYTWLYLRSRGNIWPIMVFHTTQNMMFFQVFVLPQGMTMFGVFFYIAVIACTVSFVRHDSRRADTVST